MRAQIRYPLQNIIEESVATARQSFAAQGLAGFTQSAEGAPPQLTTTAGTDAQGNTITLHPFLLGLDALGSSGPVLCVQGQAQSHPRKYFRS